MGVALWGTCLPQQLQRVQTPTPVSPTPAHSLDAATGDNHVGGIPLASENRDLSPCALSPRLDTLTDEPGSPATQQRQQSASGSASEEQQRTSTNTPPEPLSPSASVPAHALSDSSMSSTDCDNIGSSLSPGAEPTPPLQRRDSVPPNLSDFLRPCEGSEPSSPTSIEDEMYWSTGSPRSGDPFPAGPHRGTDGRRPSTSRMSNPWELTGFQRAKSESARRGGVCVVGGATVAEFSTHDGSFVVVQVGSWEAGGGQQRSVRPRDRRSTGATDGRRRHASYNGGPPSVQQREYVNQAWDARSARLPTHPAGGRGGGALPQVRVSLTDQQRTSSGSGTALSLSPFWIEVGPTSSPLQWWQRRDAG
ncbi:MAG: hypothetical protein WDW36_002857 [Sanguina aurantia]